MSDDLTLADMQDRVRERAAAYLTLYSENESPDALAMAVGLKPDQAWQKGDARGRLRKPAPSSAVEYDSGLSEDHPPSECVSALACRLRPFGAQIHAVTAREGNWGVVRLVEHAGFAIAEHQVGNVEARVQSVDLETFAALGVSLVFDAYMSPNDD